MVASLNKQKILVAGAGGLLGKAIVRELIARDCAVIAVDLDAVVLKERLEASGVDVTSPNLALDMLDVTSSSEVVEFFSRLTDITGAVNASYPRNASYGAKFFDVTLDSFNENLSLHLGSAFLFAQQCAAYFTRTQSPFSLVNVASVYGVVAPRFAIYDGTAMTMPVEYAAIKAGLIHLNRYVCAFVADSRFRANCVSPGGIKDRQPEQFLAAYQRETHGRGMLAVEDVIGTVLFLLGPESAFVTGQNIVVDDGFSL